MIEIHNPINELWLPLHDYVCKALDTCTKHGINVTIHTTQLDLDPLTKDISKSCPNLHEFGLAFDFSIRFESLNTIQFVGEIFESFGFTWGGRWPEIVNAKHIQWDRGIGNRPRSFDKIFREGGVERVYLYITKPDGTERSEKQFDVFFNGEPLPCFLIHGEIFTTQKIQSSKTIEIDGERYYLLYGHVKNFDITKWPVVEGS